MLLQFFICMEMEAINYNAFKLYILFQTKLIYSLLTFKDAEKVKDSLSFMVKSKLKIFYMCFNRLSINIK